MNLSYLRLPYTPLADVSTPSITLRPYNYNEEYVGLIFLIGAKDFKPYNGLLLRKQQTDEFEMLVEVQIITCLPTQQNQKQIGVIYARFIRDFIIL